MKGGSGNTGTAQKEGEIEEGGRESETVVVGVHFAHVYQR